MASNRLFRHNSQALQEAVHSKLKNCQQKHKMQTCRYLLAQGNAWSLCDLLSIMVFSPCDEKDHDGWGHGESQQLLSFTVSRHNSELEEYMQFFMWAMLMCRQTSIKLRLTSLVARHLSGGQIWQKMTYLCRWKQCQGSSQIDAPSEWALPERPPPDHYRASPDSKDVRPEQG